MRNIFILFSILFLFGCDDETETYSECLDSCHTDLNYDDFDSLVLCGDCESQCAIEHLSGGSLSPAQKWADWEDYPVEQHIQYDMHGILRECIEYDELICSEELTCFWKLYFF